MWIKHLLFYGISMLGYVGSVTAQQNSAVAIGKDQPSDNAVLLLHSINHNQGLIIPVSDRNKIPAPSSGMVVFDQNDRSIFYHDGTKWISVGAPNGTTSNLRIEVLGNTIRLMNGTVLVHSTTIASTNPSANQLLSWNGSSWVASSLTGDVAHSGTTLEVIGMLGKPLPPLPTLGKALVYTGTAWEFQPLSSLPAITNAAPIVINNSPTGIQVGINQAGASQDGYLSSSDWNVFNDKLGGGTSAGGDLSGTYPDPTVKGLQGLPVAPNYPNDGQVLRWSDSNTQWQPEDAVPAGFAGGDLAGSYPNPTVQALQGFLVSGNAPVHGQVLKWNDVDLSWTPTADDIGSGAMPVLNDGEVLLGNGASNFATALTGDATINSTGTLTIADNSISSNKIADNAVTTSEILNDAVTNEKILSVSATKVTDILDSYIPKGSNSTSLVHSQIRDDGSSVGINTGPSAIAKLAILNFTKNKGIFIHNWFVNSFVNSGIESFAAGSTASNVGVVGLANNSSGIAYGIQGVGIGTPTGTGDCYGVYGKTSGLGVNYAVYGDMNITGGTSNYGGYFRTLANQTTLLATGLSSHITTSAMNSCALIGLEISIDKQTTQQGLNHLIKAGYAQAPLANLSSPLFNRYGLHITNEQYNYLSGRLSIGSTNDGYGNLQVQQGADPATDGIWLTDGTSTYSFWIDAASQNLTLRKNGVGMIGSFDNSTGVYSSISDSRRKKNVESLYPVLESLLKLRPRTYLMNEQGDEEPRTIGFLAQEVKELFPEVVKYNPKDDLFSVDYSAFAVIAIKAIQEQALKIEELLRELAQTRNCNSEIELLKAEFARFRKTLSTTNVTQGAADEK
jgi:hypothetical protein